MSQKVDVGQQQPKTQPRLRSIDYKQFAQKI